MHLIYITFPEKTEAVKVAGMLVRNRLAACVNVYENVTSIYEWEGKIQQNEEVTMICKVADQSVEDVIKAVTKKHTNACPCIISIKVEKGNEDFLKWVETSSKVDY